jgi:hypothetical protein
MQRTLKPRSDGRFPSFPRRRESRLDPGSESGVTVKFSKSDKNFGNWFNRHTLSI